MMRKAFTLIELLVTISIIGILLSIISVSFTTAQKRARDARRQEDLNKIQNAFEQYYAENNTYPNGANIDNAFQGSRPTDPKNNGEYNYNWNHISNTNYCICAKLEQAGAGNADAPTSTTCNWNNTNGNYLCIQNQQ